jgi:arylsulfatase A-like enzyme
MPRTFFTLVTFLFLALLANDGHAAAKKPNVIVFLVDDMGWMDSTPYGSQYYETPRMERFASQSMRFTDAYSCPICSPTRASILTGKYAARHRITVPCGHLPSQPPGYELMPKTASPKQATIQPRSKNYLDPSEYTLAEALRDAGYKTGHFGKWHLGLDEQYWPERQGFEVALHGTPDPGPASYFSPGYYRTSQTFADGPPGEYITDRLTDETIKFIETNRDKPFFVNLWHHSVHGPWGFKKEYADKFVDRKDPRGFQGNPIMASMLQSVDESLGKILDKLDELKLADDTVVVFYSDNGGNDHSNTEDEAKSKNREAKQSEMMAAWRKYAGNQPPTINTPLRSGKGWLYEGGTRVPCMVRWPKVVEAGTVEATPVACVDLYPTLLELAGIAPNPKQKVDGASLVPLLNKTGKLEREAIFNYYPHGSGLKPPGVWVRAGDWKLIRWFETNRSFPDKFELYNLRDDIGEEKNLATAEPERVKHLDGLIDGFLKDTDALVPIPNPAYEPRAAAANKKTGTPDDPIFDGWRPKGAKGVMKDGVLTVTGENRSPFLGITGLKHSGDVVLRLRARPAAGPVKVQWRTADQETFPDEGQVVEATLPGGNDWSQLLLPLPTKGSVMHVRLYLPAQKAPVEVDWIELTSKSGKKQRWDFN